MMRRSCLALLCLAVLPHKAPGQTAEQKQVTVQYLRALQTPGGGFLPAATEQQPSLRATLATLRALKYFGGEPKNREAARTFVQQCHDKEKGGFGVRPGEKSDVHATALGLMAVTELKLPAANFAAAVAYLNKHAQSFEEIRIALAGLEAIGKRPADPDAWRAVIGKSRRPDGTFGPKADAVRDTGGAVAALLRLGDTISHADIVLKTLQTGQRRDGGFSADNASPSDLDTTYRVLRSLVMLKAKPAHPDRLRTFVAQCRNADGGYGAAAGKPSSAAATYFAAITLHWLNTPLSP